MSEAIILVLALVLIAARKPIARAIERKMRKLGKKTRSMAKAGMVWLARAIWKGIKAAGRELRAQASWLSTDRSTACA